MPKVGILKYENGRRCWSRIKNKYYNSYHIEDQIWAHSDVPLKTELHELEDAIKIVISNPGDCKDHRPALFRFECGNVPLKQFIGIDKWDGLIFVDIDLDKSPRVTALSPEMHALLYDQLDFALHNIMPNNFMYIEHSSSGIGIHCFLYFNDTKTIESYNKYTKYVYQCFRYKIDDYIKDFSHIFTDPACLKENGNSKVFDDVYKRPYQKVYMTGKDYRYYNVNGSCEGIEVEEDEETNLVDEGEICGDGHIKVEYITQKKQYELHYYDRLYVLTALKRYVGDKMTAYKLWYEFCQNLTLYKNNTVNSFINEFEKNWDKVDPSTGHLSILKKYKFKVDDSKIYYELKEGQYLGDIYDDIIRNAENGINFLIAHTGIGKNHSLILMNDKYLHPMEIDKHRPILVIEPLNSIIDTKYDKSKFRIVTGSKHIGNLSSYEMVITNYNHLVHYTIDGMDVMENINEFFSKFELVIIDESHIMLKDSFRAEVLVPFILGLRSIDSTKIIIQTASPMFEHYVLPIKKTFIINKPCPIQKKIIFREAAEEFNIQDITCLVDYYVNNGKKVYIYWNNGALQNMLQFKSLYHSPEKIVIYHKRNKDNIDMQYVTEHHNIEQFNIIMSSVYFGVGNDLNDILDDVAVIIIGNNPWQEDIQADGRWRNVKSMEICVILQQKDMDVVKVTANSTFNYIDRYNELKYRYDSILRDKFIKDKSVIINGVGYTLKNEQYCEIIAHMQASYDYSAQFKIKCDELERRGYDVRRSIKPLETNDEWTDEIKKYKKDLKDIRNKYVKDMINGIYDYNIINTDTKLVNVAKVIKKLQNKDLLKYCDFDKFTYRKIMAYSSFIRYYEKRYFNQQDYAELFSILWCRNKLLDCELLGTGDILYKFKVNDEEVELSKKDYILTCGYLIWYGYRNKGENNELLSYSYFNKFKYVCYDMCKIEESLINRLFVDNYYNDVFNDTFDYHSINANNMFDAIEKIIEDNDLYKKPLGMIINNIIKKSDRQSNNSSKSCTITKKFKGLNKYNVEIGQKFDNGKALSEHTGVSIKTVWMWRKKGYIV